MTSENETRKSLLSAKEFAKMISLSFRQVHRLNSCGKIPAPVKVGGSLRWKLEDIEQWIAMRCPDRKTFEAQRGEIA